MAVCQSLQTTTDSLPGAKGSTSSACSAALENSKKRFWLSLKSRPLFCPYSFAPVLPHTCHQQIGMLVPCPALKGACVLNQRWDIFSVYG